jgi:SAM-dependent methyltransferase
MREDLLDWLVCPACEGGEWGLERVRADHQDLIAEGWLDCAACGARYAISDGIVDLLPQPADSVLRERAGWERFLQDASEEMKEEWILSLPCVHEGVTSNVQSIAHWKRQANNFSGLMELLGLRGGERVLELGAGRCWASAHLARAGCRVVALDVVRDRQAGGLETGDVYLRHGTPPFERVLASMEKLPFRPGTFDLVFSVASIHHSPVLGQVVARCARVLRGGGKLALTSEPCYRVLRDKRVDNAETEAGINEHAYSILDYRQAFMAAGLQPRYALPGALQAMLEGHEEAPQAGWVKSSLFALTRRMWQGKWTRRVLGSQWANLAGLLFLEYGLTAVARKPLGGEE